jgi:hypothetical protein
MSMEGPPRWVVLYVLTHAREDQVLDLMNSGTPPGTTPLGITQSDSPSTNKVIAVSVIRA